LSQLVGAGGLAADRMSRRLGFARVAAAQLALVDDDVRAAAEAYARGINQGLAIGLSGRPHEFVLLRSHPTPWQVTDVLAFAGLQAFALGANWDMELARLKILAEDGPDALRALDHVYPADHPLSVPVATAAGPAMNRLADDLAAFASAAPSPGGSNNWAIAGARTVSGVPLLANDPHLAARLPAPWYLAHLRCPEWEVAGASFVGGPVFPIAHTGRAAWGITAGMTDQADLFIEEIGDDGASVREGEQMVPCQVIDEVIEVRGGDSVTERVLLTRHGPIVSPFLDGAPAALSLSAVWLRPMPIRGFLACLRARDFESFRQGFAAWPGPALNVVYADASGHVGYQLVGQLPLRRRGHGTLPMPGWRTSAGRTSWCRLTRCRTSPIPPSASWPAPTTALPPTARDRTWAWTGWTATAWPASWRSWPGATIGTWPAARHCSSMSPAARGGGFAALPWSCRSATRTAGWQSPSCVAGTGG
jgi:penicillin G amidase